MAFPINYSLSIYIPIVQKWHATPEYVKNAFRYAFMGEVVRVDFVARNGGDPELAKEMSAFVYLDWANNEFAYNWQKVIYEKDPKMPAHLYHTVGPNYWILIENMKPRSKEQVAEEKAVILNNQAQKLIDLERENFSQKLTIATLKANIANLEKKNASSEQFNQVNMISDLRSFIEKQEETIETTKNMCQEMKKQITYYEKEIEELEKEQVQNLARKNRKIKLQEQIFKTIQEDLDMHREKVASLEYEINMKQHNISNRTESETQTESESQSETQILQTETKKNDYFTKNEVKFKCNSCSTSVVFTTDCETPSTKKHLCNNCFIKTGAWLQ